MSDADKAFEIAEKQVARVRREGDRYIWLSPHYDWRSDLHSIENVDLASLERIPDSITELTGVTSVYLGGTQVKDISILAQMTWLNILDLSATLVEDLSPCTALDGLTQLELYGAAVSDIHMLAHLTEMQILVLNSTRVTDISALARMTKLHTLWLKDTSVDVLQLVAEGTAFADKNRDLESLSIWGTPATLNGAFLSKNFDGYENETGYASAVLAALRAERDRRRACKIRE